MSLWALRMVPGQALRGTLEGPGCFGSRMADLGDCKLGEGRRVPSSPVQRWWAKGTQNPLSKACMASCSTSMAKGVPREQSSGSAAWHSQPSRVLVSTALLNQLLLLQPTWGQSTLSKGLLALNWEEGLRTLLAIRDSRNPLISLLWGALSTGHLPRQAGSSSPFKRCWAIKTAQRISLPEI